MEWTFLLSADQKVSKDESLVTDNAKVIKCLCRAWHKVVSTLEGGERERQCMPRCTGNPGDYATLTVSWGTWPVAERGYCQLELGIWGMWMSRWHFGLFFTFLQLLCSFRNMLPIDQQLSILDLVGNREKVKSITVIFASFTEQLQKWDKPIWNKNNNSARVLPKCRGKKLVWESFLEEVAPELCGRLSRIWNGAE